MYITKSAQPLAREQRFAKLRTHFIACIWYYLGESMARSGVVSWTSSETGDRGASWGAAWETDMACWFVLLVVRNSGVHQLGDG